MMDWITASWDVPDNIHALTTTRSGGLSHEGFSSLNLADHVSDNLSHVLANRQRLKEQLALPNEPVWLQQTHSTIVVQADQVLGCPEADASYTDQKNIVCSVLTADCLPILLCDQYGRVVSAVHAGWRGLLDGIIEKSIFNMPKTDLLAWLGPAIGAECFEVGVEVYVSFIQRSVQFSSAFKEQAQGKYLADIYQIAKVLLNQAGVEKIYGGHYCTVTDAEYFFSYRREKQTGRMATLIWKT